MERGQAAAPVAAGPPHAGKNLQAQYERWQPRAKYKMHLDPTTEDVKKLAISCRRTAKARACAAGAAASCRAAVAVRAVVAQSRGGTPECLAAAAVPAARPTQTASAPAGTQGERVLFHYNGHGVPRPTANGEVWVFNKSYTQYIPLSIYDLQTWVGTPAIYVFDCSAAGQILHSFRVRGDRASRTEPLPRLARAARTHRPPLPARAAAIHVPAAAGARGQLHAAGGRGGRGQRRRAAAHAKLRRQLRRCAAPLGESADACCMLGESAGVVPAAVSH